MKNPARKTLRSVFACWCLFLAFLANHAGATISYWDPQGTNNGYATFTNGTLDGVWETNLWARNSAGATGSPADQGTNAPIGWTDSDAAMFAVGAGATNAPGSVTNTTAFTMTMNSNHIVAGVFDGPLTTHSCIVTINGPGIMTVPAGLQGFNIANSTDGSVGQVIISNTIAGTGVVTAEANGQLFLYGNNTYTGGTHLGYSGAAFSGTVNFNNAASFGTGSITLSNGNGSALVLTGSSALTITNPFIIRQPANLNIVGNPAGLTFSGPWTLSNTSNIGSGNSANNLVIISGVMSGAGGLGKDHAGILRLSGANTYSGTTTVTNGILQLGANGGLPSGNSKGVLNLVDNGTVGGVLDLNGFSGTVDGLIGNGTVNNSTGTGTLSVGTSGTNSSFSGPMENIGGTLNLTKVGAGTFTMSGANSYSGVTAVSAGTLVCGANNVIPNASQVVVATGATVDLNGTSEAIASLSGGGSVINNTQPPLIVNGALSTSSFNAYSCFFGSISNAVSKSGSHVMSLRQTNFYGLTFTFSSGTLSVGAGPDRLPPTFALTVPASGLFQLDANSQTVSSLAGSGKLNLGGGTLTVNQAGSTTFSGVIRNSELAGSSTALGHGLRGYYYDNSDFSNLKAVRDDATVNFPDFTITNAITALPDAGMTNTIFSMRWLGQVLTTVAGTYTFTTTSDDGQRLWVNGTLLIDDWASHGATAKSGTITLAANTRYDLVMEYFNGLVSASTKLAWTPPGDSVSTVIPTDFLFLPGPGSLVKTGAGTLTLTATNTYTGLTTVSQGTLDVRSNSGLGKGNVSVASGATLLLELASTNGYISPSADLLLNGSSPVVNLNYSGADNIHALSLDGGTTYQPVGTYGTTASGATHPDDVRFQGLGRLNVTAGPSANVLTASANSTVYGSSITFTSTITGSGATPTGSVTFYDGANAIGVAALDGTGKAILSVSDFLVTTSPHSVKAVYGGDANYVQSTSSSLSQSVTALTISPGVLTVSNKVYDATTAAIISTLSATALVGVLPGDTNFVHITGGGASFVDKTAGLGKTANVTNLSIAGSLADNYFLSPTNGTGTGNISNKVLTVTGITASNRVYNATTSASLNTSGATLVGVIVIVPAENVTLNTAGATGSFATATTNNNKTVSVAGLTLSGADAPNYTVTQPTTTANITQASSAEALTSSFNPSGLGSSVTFTATLTAVAPGAGTPGGNVIFLTNGVTPLSSNASSGGVATSAGTATLPLGTNTITAQYVGDANFLGVTNTFQQVVQNTVCSQTNVLLSIIRNGGNSFTLNLRGTFQSQYSVVAQTNLTQPMTNWLPVPGSAIIITNPAGLWSVTVTNPAPAFYRAKATSVCP